MKVIPLRRADMCAQCGKELPVGAEASWDASTKIVTCLGCIASPSPPSAGVAGASARAKGKQLRSDQEERRRQLKSRRPLLGRVQIALAGPATAGATYAKGAAGEERLGAALDALAPQGVLALHDRRRP